MFLLSFLIRLKNKLILELRCNSELIGFDQLEIEPRFIMDRHLMDFSDAMHGSDNLLSIEPSSMGFSVFKFVIPQNSTVVSVCATVIRAEQLEIYMWQKDPTGFYSPTLLVQKDVCSFLNPHQNFPTCT